MKYSKKHIISQIIKIRESLDRKDFIVTKRIVNSLIAELLEYEAKQEKTEHAPLSVFYDG